MKKWFFLFAAVGLLLCACSAAEPMETAAPTAAETIPETAAPTEQLTENPTARLQAYQQLLRRLLRENITPDGDTVPMDGSFGAMEDNSFALADVDADGKPELIVSFSTAPMAGMCAWICGYDPEADSTYVELSVFPNLTFYDNGILEAGWSHNQGLAGEFWPYTLMEYRSDTRSFTAVAHVDAWSREAHERDFDGNPYPQELDSENAGYLYYLRMDEEEETLTQSQYQAWHRAVVGGGQVLPIDYSRLTEENIEQLIA